MKITDAKDGVIKLESFEKAALSSFLEINSSKNDYIAQVIRESYNGAGYTVYARILFNYDGALLNYDKTLPDTDAEIKPFSFDIISKTFDSPEMLTINEFEENGCLLKINSECAKNLLISVDNKSALNTLVSNITMQNKKSIIIDTDSSFEGERYYAGKDFKLPFDIGALDFIYNECLNEATAESKALIKDIFKDLAEYIKTAEFLPFEQFKSIIDDMVEKSHEFRLIVLRNALKKLSDLKYFASSKKEADALKPILESDYAILDFSKTDSKFLNRYIQYVYSKLEKSDSAPQVVVKLSDGISKKTINKLYTSNIPAIFAINSRYRYHAGIISLFKNYIVDSNSANKEVYYLYKPFLDSMTSGQCLFVGNGTNNIPIVFKAEKLTLNQIEKVKSDNKSVSETEENSLVDELYKNIDSKDSSDEIESVEENETIIPQEQDEIDSEELQSEDNIQEESIISDASSSGLFKDDEFHTVVDTTKIEKFEPAEETENSTEEINEDVNEIEELNSNQDISSIEEEKEEHEIEASNEIIESNNVSENLENEEIIEDDSTIVELNSDEIDSEIIENIEESSQEVEETAAEDISEEKQEFEEPDTETLAEFNEARDINIDELSVLPLSQNEEEFNNDEIIELNETESNNDDILVDIDEDDTIIENIQSEDLDKEIVEDVDKVFTTVKDESISDNDLDFIDELNEIDTEETDDSLLLGDGMEELEELAIPQEEENDFEEPLAEISDSLPKEDSGEILETRQSNTPIVPVYDAEIPPEDMVSSDPIEQGDTVIHAKYGTGIVEKMIKYGNKNLYSINFDNVGRRLLDPTLTELKKSGN